MPETDTAHISVPRPNVMRADRYGVKSWAPAFDSITVENLRDGWKLVKVTVKSHPVAEFRPSPDVAATLASKLTAKAGAA